MTISYEDKQTAERLVVTTLADLGCPLTIRVEWNKSKRVAGDAWYIARRIRFSTVAWEHMVEQERWNTVVHEVCHIVSDYQAGYRVKPHGIEWKNLMVRCGADPKRTWKPSESFYKAGHGRKQHIRAALTVCGCGEHPITKNRFTRMRNGAQYRCKTCRQVLRAA